MTAVLLCGEGPHDIGTTKWDSKTRKNVFHEGWLQPMVRKAILDCCKIDTKMTKQIFLMSRPAALKPAPRGHGDKAAMARFIAAQEGYDVVVFMVDADTNDEAERQEKVADIRSGFAAVENRVRPVACVPRSASEAWLLGDRGAWEEAGLPPTAACFPKSSPEDLWGERNDPNANHPKHAFHRVAEASSLDDDRETRRRISESSNVEEIKRSCPISFSEFFDELESKRLKA